MPKVDTPVTKQIHTSTSRPVVRTEIEFKKYVVGNIPVADVKKLIGWKEVKDGMSHLTDFHGNKIRLENSMKNRPFQMALSLAYVSEILNGRWELNGETIVVTNTNEVASGQHRLVAYILARQEYEKHPERWQPILGDIGPKMPCLVVFGIENSDRVVNTIDTGKSRSAEDVLYRTDLYAGVDERERRKLVKVAAYGGRTFADRTRSWDDAFAPKRTVNDLVDLLHRHPTLAGDPLGEKQPKSTCARFVWDENDEDRIQKTFGLSPGTVAGMMYLMATSQTENPVDGYHRQDHPDETLLDVGMLEKAEEFLTEAVGGKLHDTIQKARRQLLDADGQDMGQGGRLAILIKAWNTFRDGKKFTVDAITPKVTQDNGGELVYGDDGVLAAEVTTPDGDTQPQVRVLAESPTVGGIDLGGEPLEDDKDAVTDGDPDVIRGTDEPPAKPSKKPAKGKPAVVGAECLVKDADGDWTGKLIDVYLVRQEDLDESDPEWAAQATIGERRAIVQQFKGRKSWDVPYDACSLVE